ncbi:hypothetical protein V8Z80_18520 [Orrella sp. JC864]|uniref:hypothetical protein n=1 Tax=Orrella sp. JC864 TaxID=3120298 RepID=UPI003008DEB3
MSTPENRRPSHTSKIGTSSEPGHGKPKEDAVERELDEALEDTFPASDPVAVTHDPDHAAQAERDKVDKALKDTFPASDPPPTTPRKP